MPHLGSTPAPGGAFLPQPGNNNNIYANGGAANHGLPGHTQGQPGQQAAPHGSMSRGGLPSSYGQGPDRSHLMPPATMPLPPGGPNASMGPRVGAPNQGLNPSFPQGIRGGMPGGGLPGGGLQGGVQMQFGGQRMGQMMAGLGADHSSYGSDNVRVDAHPRPLHACTRALRIHSPPPACLRPSSDDPPLLPCWPVCCAGARRTQRLYGSQPLCESRHAPGA